jgi:site-specific DNA recombinase
VLSNSIITNSLYFFIFAIEAATLPAKLNDCLVELESQGCPFNFLYMTNKYFLYVRKSTDVEDKQVLSIEAQLTELRALAKRENLQIVSEFVEKQSAKALGRPVFVEMIKRIEKGEATGILCWKLDRLARNPVDGGQIQWFLQRGILQHIQTNERSYYPTDNILLMSVEFGMANQFILDLSTNTKRGLREKVRRGDYPSRAPIGYLNDSRNKTIVIDKRKSKIIKQMFELYAQDNSTLEDISLFLKDKGITSKNKNGNTLKRDRITYILSDPFYYGYFQYAGELHSGRHKAIVTKQLWDKVQVVLYNRSHKRESSKNSPQPLCGLLRCAECGCSITAEQRTKHQKNGNIHQYIYYRCTKKKVPCYQPFIRQEQLAKQLSVILKGFTMPHAWAEWLTQRAEQDSKQENNATALVLQESHQKVDSINYKLLRLKDLYLDQDIEQEEYHQDKNKLVSEKNTVEEQITRLQNNTNFWLEPLKEWIQIAQTMGEIAESEDLTAKKRAARTIAGSNPVSSTGQALLLRNKCIEFTPQMQWAALRAAHAKLPEMELSCVLESLYNSARTYCIKNA